MSFRITQELLNSSVISQALLSAQTSGGGGGTNGTQGPTGPAGSVGPVGPAGSPGADGADGAEGPQGPVGPEGPTLPVTAGAATNIGTLPLFTVAGTVTSLPLQFQELTPFTPTFVPTDVILAGSGAKFFYAQLGNIKVAHGYVETNTNPGFSSTSLAVTVPLPSGFFTTVQNVILSNKSFTAFAPLQIVRLNGNLPIAGSPPNFACTILADASMGAGVSQGVYFLIFGI